MLFAKIILLTIVSAVVQWVPLMVGWAHSTWVIIVNSTSVFDMKKIFLLLILMSPMSSIACSFGLDIFRPSFNMEAFNYDVPPVFEFSVDRIKRGQGPVSQDDGIQVTSSCDDFGSIYISIESNGKLDPCEYGYYVYDKSGTAPKGLIPRYPQRPMNYKGQCILPLHWMDGASWVQEVLDFELQFEAVNNYLYKSDRSESLPVVWFTREYQNSVSGN